MAQIVSRGDLQLSIYIALKVMPKHLRAFNDQAAEGMAKVLVERILAGDALLVQPSAVVAGDYGTRIGRWGVDEPHPLPHLLASDG